MYKMKIYTTSSFLKPFLYTESNQVTEISKSSLDGWLVKGHFCPLLHSSRILFLKVCIISETVFLALFNPKSPGKTSFFGTTAKCILTQILLLKANWHM